MNTFMIVLGNVGIF